MSLREWLNNNPRAASAGTGVLLCLALAMLLLQVRAGQPAAGDAYYYAPGVEELFVGPGDAIPPVETPDHSDDGWRAHIFACGSCPDEPLVGMSVEEVERAGAFVGYFERYEEHEKDLLERLRVAPGDMTEEEEEQAVRLDMRGPYLQRPGDAQWALEESDPGGWITGPELERRCGGPEDLVMCPP